MDKKEQIIKALKCFTSTTDLKEWTPGNCVGCYFDNDGGLCEQNCTRGLADAALALIKELYDENKKLTEQLSIVQDGWASTCGYLTIALKEFELAEQCIYDIEDALDRGADNDRARECIEKWTNRKEN